MKKPMSPMKPVKAATSPVKTATSPVKAATSPVKAVGVVGGAKPPKVAVKVVKPYKAK